MPLRGSDISAHSSSHVEASGQRAPKPITTRPTAYVIDMRTQSAGGAPRGAIPLSFRFYTMAATWDFSRCAAETAKPHALKQRQKIADLSGLHGDRRPTNEDLHAA
jgi:hypothetical protein